MREDNGLQEPDVNKMPDYKTLGIVNTREMYQDALQNAYSVPGYNFNTLEQLVAILRACFETHSPVVVQHYEIPREQLHPNLVVHMVQGILETAREESWGDKKEIPVALHLDHGSSFEMCKYYIDLGFSSVMIDGSHLSFDENVHLTKRVVEYAHARDVTVEGELGTIGGAGERHDTTVISYTRPEEVSDFVQKTDVDALAIAIGTSHGAYKFKLQPGEHAPPLRFEILQKIQESHPKLPIVLHGASSIPQDYVTLLNAHGGRMDRAIGIDEDQLRRAAGMNVCKVNIHSDAQITMTAVLREYLDAHPSVFDPREYLEACRVSLIELYMQKNRSVLLSADRA